RLVALPRIDVSAAAFCPVEPLPQASQRLRGVCVLDRELLGVRADYGDMRRRLAQPRAAGATRAFRQPRRGVVVKWRFRRDSGLGEIFQIADAARRSVDDSGAHRELLDRT